MSKEKKRTLGKPLLSAALVLVMALGFVPISAQAAQKAVGTVAAGNAPIGDAIGCLINLVMGTRFSAERIRDSRGNVIKRVFTYEFDPATERLEVSFGLQAGTEDFLNIANRQRPKAQVNAGFFGRENIGYAYSPNMIVPQGLQLDGKVYSEPAPSGYSTLFIYKDGSSEIVRTNTLDSAKVNEKAKNAVLILSGGDASAGNSRQRTMIGVRADGSAVLMVIDSNGRNTGATVAEGRQRLRDMGAVNILNLDGGGSSRMYVKGRGHVTDPLYDPNRKIGSVLQVYDK